MKIIDKVKKAIGIKVTPRLHELISIRDIPAKAAGIFGRASASSLDIALSRLKSKGVRVLDFWRKDGRWTIKVMA